MTYDYGNPSRYLKADLFGDIPIYHDTFVCSEVYSPENSFSRLYTHDMLEFSIVVDGSGVHRISNQVIPCKSGDVYAVPANIPHGYFLSDDCECLTVRRLLFDPADWFFGDVAAPESRRYCYGLFSDSAVAAYAMLNSKTRREIYSLCDAVSEEIEAVREERFECIRAYLSLILVSLGRYVNGAIRCNVDFSPKEWKTVSQVIKTVNDSFFESDLTLDSVAHAMFVSTSHLSRLFKKLIGKPFSEYLRSVRLNHACRLLSETAMTVEEIVKKCGLRDVPSFYGSFNSFTGMTPSQYRDAYSKNNSKSKKGDRIMTILSEISENLQKGKSKIVKEMVEEAIKEGCAPRKILDEGLLSGMSIVGEKFKNNEVFVPEVLVAARAMNMGVSVLKPYLVESGVAAVGRVCIGTVLGDLHDIGKNLVRMMLEGKGFEVIDLGVDVPPEKFIETAIAENCQIICLSALLTTTMSVMGDVVKAAEAAGIRDKVKIMIGGAPVSEKFCKDIGADCYTVDAASAADAAVELCKAL